MTMVSVAGCSAICSCTVDSSIIGGSTVVISIGSTIGCCVAGCLASASAVVSRVTKIKKEKK